MDDFYAFNHIFDAFRGKLIKVVDKEFATLPTVQGISKLSLDSVKKVKKVQWNSGLKTLQEPYGFYWVFSVFQRLAAYVFRIKSITRSATP